MVARRCRSPHVELWHERSGSSPEPDGWGPRAVVTPGDRAMVGHAGFHLPPRPLAAALSDPTFEGDAAPAAGGVVEIGYTILPADRRRGYAAEAVGALVTWAFESDEVTTILASVAATNEASHAVLRRVGGFREIGTCRDDDGTVETVFRPATLGPWHRLEVRPSCVDALRVPRWAAHQWMADRALPLPRSTPCHSLAKRPTAPSAATSPSATRSMPASAGGTVSPSSSPTTRCSSIRRGGGQGIDAIRARCSAHGDGGPRRLDLPDGLLRVVDDDTVIVKWRQQFPGPDGPSTSSRDVRRWCTPVVASSATKKIFST